MGLSRLLIVIILVAAGFWLWRRLSRKREDGKPQTTLAMVRCTHCGVHVPQEQALQAEGKWYCSRAHLKQDSESGGQ